MSQGLVECPTDIVAEIESKCEDCLQLGQTLNYTVYEVWLDVMSNNFYSSSTANDDGQAMYTKTLETEPAPATV